MEIKDCKKINPFDHLSIFNHIENIQVNSMLKIIEGTTCKLVYKKNERFFVIIHKSVKELNKVQCSYFDNGEPYSDIVRDNYSDILRYINVNQYTISEVLH